jgi:hypothetical protein
LRATIIPLGMPVARHLMQPTRGLGDARTCALGALQSLRSNRLTAGQAGRSRSYRVSRSSRVSRTKLVTYGLDTPALPLNLFSAARCSLRAFCRLS